uniref:Uncharacterized protein n=1 Tax=Sander lucioperca TaxID=283035 RepID=A0A8C9XFE7_SANLU
TSPERLRLRGLQRVIQPTGDDAAPDAAGLPYPNFDHLKAHFYRYDEQFPLCLERLSSSIAEKDKTKLTLQQKFVCSEVRYLRKFNVDDRAVTKLKFIQGVCVIMQFAVKSLCSLNSFGF